MTLSEEQITSLVEQVEARDRAGRRRAILYTLVPILVGCAVVWFASHGVIRARQEVDDAQEELAKATDEAESQRLEIASNIAEAGLYRALASEYEKQCATVEGTLNKAQKELGRITKEVERHRTEAERYRVVAERYHEQASELETRCARLERSAEEMRERHRAEAERFEGERSEFKGVLAELEERLRGSTNFVRHVFQLEWGGTKWLASTYPRQSEVLLFISQKRDEGVGWKLGGRSPDEGFDSPSFAEYVLTESALLDVPLSERYPLQRLDPRTGEPEVGDLIFYEMGYTMFYFEDEGRHKFCVGMTPVGIVALEVEFGPAILGYGKVDYSR